MSNIYYECPKCRIRIPAFDDSLVMYNHAKDKHDEECTGDKRENEIKVLKEAVIFMLNAHNLNPEIYLDEEKFLSYVDELKRKVEKL